MKKINNIGFVLALILCILMLFAYCNRAAASDVSIITGDTSNGGLQPDNPDYVSPSAPSNINTNIFNPYDFGDNIATNPIENTNIFSANMNFEQFNSNINSNSMYYTKDILNSMNYNYYSIFAFIYNQFDFEIPYYTPVDVRLSSIKNSIVTTGYINTSTQPYYTDDDDKFFDARTFRCTEVVPDSLSYYAYCYLIVDMPYYTIFDNFSNNVYEEAFYIDEIIFDTDEVILSNKNEIYSTHLFDVCFPKSTYITPKDNTTFLSAINNIGSYAYQYDLTNIEYMLISQLDFNGEKLTAYSDFNNYIFEPKEGKFLYTSYQNLSDTFDIDYVAFVNYDYYLDCYSFYGFNGLIFDTIDRLVNDFKSFETLPDINNDSNASYNFFKVGYDVNGVGDTGGILPFYTSFNFFTLMPSGSTDGFGNISYDDVNASKYYIEPQDWKDFGAHFNNIVVWLCFEMPLLSTITKPIYLFLNGFLEIWTQIALPLATALGLIGGALIFYLIYLFISKLLFNKAPD